MILAVIFVGGGGKLVDCEGRGDSPKRGERTELIWDQVKCSALWRCQADILGKEIGGDL